VDTTESGQTIYEADETLPIELDAASILHAAGFRVVVSRTGPTSVVKLGPAGADALVGIYFDAGLGGQRRQRDRL
jgi:N-acetylmuramoyl-L-alanine amidase